MFEIKGFKFESWWDLVDEGGVLMLIGVSLVLTLILLLLFRVVTRPGSCGRSLYLSIKKKLIYNALFRYLLQSCLKWQVALTAALLLLANSKQ